MSGLAIWLSNGDLQLAILVALVCVHASFTAISLFHRARGAHGRSRAAWAVTAGITTGFGIWATHFLATLAFGVSYDYAMASLSFMAALTVVTAGFGFAIYGPPGFNAPLGGAIVGIGIVLTDYLGLSALSFSNPTIWYFDFLVLSAGLGILFGTAAMTVAVRGDDTRTTIVSALLLILAIAGQQLMAASAFVVSSDGIGVAPMLSLSPTVVALGIAGASVVVLELGLVTAFLDRYATDSALRAAARFRGLAEATNEGLAICEDEAIVDTNSRLSTLVGLSAEQLSGKPLKDLIHEISGTVPIGPGPVEVALRGPENEPIPCEVTARTIPHGARTRTVVSFRDLRAYRLAEQKIAHLSSHDGLTDLPNRAAFSEHLALMLDRAVTAGEPFAVLCLELDRFKEVNNLFGSQVGDAFLRKSAHELVAAAGGAFLARVGGDDFALISADGPQPSGASGLADRLLATMAKEFEVDGHPLRTGLSIGVAFYPQDGADAVTLLGNADAALYRARADGGGSVRFFHADMDTRLRKQRALQHAMESALRRSEFFLQYQPQVRLPGELIGFEALIRWKQPNGTIIPPSEFIPLAEESGLIVPLGEWVLREACREAASWPNKELQIAINLSPAQFRGGDLPQSVHMALFETGLAPGRLELEITEGVLISDASYATSVLRRLKTLGVRIAMDDFGSGNSSLSYLQSFPFDKIKIDQSFISKLGSSIQSAAIIRAVLGLARGLGLPVLAEGVETKEQLLFLSREGCNEVQGFLVGRPLVIEDYAEWVGRTQKQQLSAAG